MPAHRRNMHLATIMLLGLLAAGDALLLFHRSEEMDGLKEWNEHGDEEELMSRARSQWELFRF